MQHRQYTAILYSLEMMADRGGKFDKTPRNNLSRYLWCQVIGCVSLCYFSERSENGRLNLILQDHVHGCRLAIRRLQLRVR